MNPKESTTCGYCQPDTEFVKKIVRPVNAIKGYDLPVSAFRIWRW